MDSEGRVCGRDPGVEERPFLVRFNNDSCDDCLICWHSCPREDFFYLFIDTKSLEAVGKTIADIEVADIKGADVVDAFEEGYKKEKAKLESMNDETGSNGNNTSTKEKRSAEKKKTDTEEKTPSAHEKNTKPREKDVHAAETTTSAIEKNLVSGTMSLDAIEKPDSNNDDAQGRKKHMICKPEVDLELVQSFAELNHLVQRKKCAESYQKTLNPPAGGGRCNDARGEISKTQYDISRSSRDLSNTKLVTLRIYLSANLLCTVWFIRVAILNINSWS